MTGTSLHMQWHLTSNLLYVTVTNIPMVTFKGHIFLNRQSFVGWLNLEGIGDKKQKQW
jgi:hypothetical protein